MLATAGLKAKVMEKPARVICFGDSECTISSCECRTATLAPYFSNSVAEVLDTFTRFREQGIKVDPLYWVPGDQNPADQGTREDVQAVDIGPGSVHWAGPVWMKLPITDWPMSRDILRRRRWRRKNRTVKMT